MKRFFKDNAVSVIICLIGFSLLAVRGYGYYTNDQSAFTLIADAFAQTGKIIAYPEDYHNPYYGNFHPPLLIVLLGGCIRLGGLLFGPAMFQLLCMGACLLGLLATLRTVHGDRVQKGKQEALCALFFLIPFTHEAVLFLDIDNSLLAAWGSWFLFAHYHTERTAAGTLRSAAIMGATFAIGFWCKFTTPLAVYAAWALWTVLVSQNRWRGTVTAGGTIAIAAALFLATYLPFIYAQDLPAWSCFSITADKLRTHVSGNATAPLFGSALRAMFYDMHWFSFLFLPLVIALTMVQLRDCAITRQWLRSRLPLLLFLTVYGGYTFIIPTSDYYMPRYKFGLLPFAVFWMSGFFENWISKVKKSRLIGLGAVAVLLVFLLPDFPTSAARLEARYHSFAIAPVAFQYYPESQTRLIKAMADYSERSVALIPLRAAMFFIHYWSITGILMFLLFCSVAATAFLIHRSIIGSLWLTILPLWASMFMMNMSREYQLFYDAGAGGFKETVGYLRHHLNAGERFLGYRDLVVYTGHQAFCLYDYADGGRKLDTVRIDSLSRTRGLRYCAFLNDEIYKNDTIFHRYLKNQFDTAFVYRDYRVWKKAVKQASVKN